MTAAPEWTSLELGEAFRRGGLMTPACAEPMASGELRTAER